MFLLKDISAQWVPVIFVAGKPSHVLDILFQMSGGSPLDSYWTGKWMHREGLPLGVIEQRNPDGMIVS